MNKVYLKSLFGIYAVPVLKFSLPDISFKAQELAGKLSISGVQPKLSLKLDKRNKELIPVAEGGEYILKPQPAAFPHLPENEQCCMDIAETIGIDTPKHCLISLPDGSMAYLVKRFDRRGKNKINQEDFSQILGLEKYRGSVEQVGRRLKELSTAPGLDVQLFFERVVFSFLVGNGDAHLKNYSVNYLEEGRVRLSPAYDIVSSKLVIPSEEDSALTINGKKNKLDRNDFDALADYFNIPGKVCYENLISKLDVARKIINESFLSRGEKEKFTAIAEERYRRMRF